MSGDPRFKGLEIELHRYSGARVLRVVHPGRQEIDEHEHDWAYIGLYTSGRYLERYDGGEADMSGPCAVLHPAGRPHADLVHEQGLETLTLEFDPAWLRVHGFAGKLDRSWVWSEGSVAFASRRLARLLSASVVRERDLGNATRQFLEHAFTHEARDPPQWVPTVRRWIDEEPALSAGSVAQRLDLHPAYVAQAYRLATGEGIGELLRRRRVETATALLRRTALPLAEIAVAAGFCDQSHMNRCFSAILGRTPHKVRFEAHMFAERVCS